MRGYIYNIHVCVCAAPPLACVWGHIPMKYGSSNIERTRRHAATLYVFFCAGPHWLFLVSRLSALLRRGSLSLLLLWWWLWWCGAGGGGEAGGDGAAAAGWLAAKYKSAAQRGVTRI